MKEDNNSQFSILNSPLIPPGYKQTEVGMIPEDWEVAKLAAVCSMKSGEGITSASIDQFSEYPCYGGNGLRGFTARFTHDGRYGLIGRQGALCGNVLGVEGKLFASEHAIVVTPSARTDIRWLTFVLGEMRLNQYSESSAQPGLSVSKLLSLDIARAPTKAEQEAIAEALSDADALIESLDQLLAKKRHLKQGAMQELLTGKKRLPGFSGEWEVKRLADESDLITKGTTPTSLGRHFTEQGINFVKVESLTESGTVIPEMLAAVDEETHRLLKRSQLREDDILFSIAGALGRTAIVNIDLLPANTNQALAIIRLKPSSRLHHGFLLKYLSSPQISTHINAINVQAAQANLSLEDIRNFEVPAPSADEQEAITAILSDMDTEIAALEAKLAKARRLKQGMMQELLTGKIRLV